VVIHSYRHRHGNAPGDPDLEPIERQLADRPTIRVPTFVLHGGSDGVTPPEPSADSRSDRFTGPFESRVVPDAGHFFPREAPQEVVDAIVALLA
jgi:pimeloyl-ACP methyl ester carboxylesterase